MIAMLDKALLILKDKTGNVVKRIPLNFTIPQILNKLGLDMDIDPDDTIQIEKEAIENQ